MTVILCRHVTFLESPTPTWPHSENNVRSLAYYSRLGMSHVDSIFIDMREKLAMQKRSLGLLVVKTNTVNQLG